MKKSLAGNAFAFVLTAAVVFPSFASASFSDNAISVYRRYVINPLSTLIYNLAYNQPEVVYLPVALVHEAVEEEASTEPVILAQADAPIVRTAEPVSDFDLVEKIREILRLEYENTGAPGPQGLQGEQGPQGPRGQKGDTPDISHLVTQDLFDAQTDGSLTSIENAIDGLRDDLEEEVSSESFRLTGETGTITVVPAAAGGSYTLTMPTDDGTAGQMLTTDGDGILSWSTVAASPWTESGSDIYFTGGNVGIGDATPTEALTIGDTTTVTSTSQYAQKITLSDTGTGNLSDAAYATGLGIENDILTAAATGRYRGGKGIYIDMASDATVTNNGELYLYGLDAITSYSGSTTGTTVQAIGVSATASGNMGTTGANYHYGGVFTAAGTATNNYGLLASASGADNNYGIRISAPSAAATNYALYSDATAQSYFAGNVGIGDTTPDYAFTVNESTTHENTTSSTYAQKINITDNGFGSDEDFPYVIGLGVEEDMSTGSLTNRYRGGKGIYVDVASDATVAGAGELYLYGADIRTTYSGAMSGAALALYGVNASASGNLGTNDITQHIGLNATASGTADYNYGIIASAVGGTNNYGIYISQPNTAAATNYALYSNALAQSYFAGNVGIGDTTPDASLDVNLTTAATGSSTAGILDLVDSAGGTGATETVLNVTGTLSGTLTNDINTTDVLGINVNPNVSYTLSNDGLLQFVQLYGVSSNPSFSGSLTDATDSFYMFGLYTAPSSNLGTAADTMKYGLFSSVSGTADTNYGASISASGATTNYGLDVFVNSGANNYAVYSSGTAQSYFAGNVGIGDTTPDAKLDVEYSTSTANSSTAAQVLTYTDSGNISTVSGPFTKIGQDTSATYSGSFTAPTESLDFIGSRITSTFNGTVNGGGSGSVALGYGAQISSTFGGSLTANDTGIVYGATVTSGGDLGTAANTEHYGLQVNVSGTADINTGISAGASGATSNYAAIFNPGFVGIGMSAPSVALDVDGDIEYTGTITDVSDERLKENIEDFSGALDIITKLDAKRYNMKDGDEEEIGFIAQEVQKIFPGVISVIDPKNGYMGMSYVSLIPVVSEAVKELDLKLESVALPLEKGSDESFAERFFGKLAEWLGEAGNGIGELFAETFRAKDKLCINDTCVTEAQLIELLEDSGQSSSPAPTSEPDPQPEPAPEENTNTGSEPVVEEPTAETPAETTEPASEETAPAETEAEAGETASETSEAPAEAEETAAEPEPEPETQSEPATEPEQVPAE